MPRFERLEPRSLLAASLTPAAPPNETLDAAYELGHLSTGMEVEDYGSIGNGPAGGADVEWYTYTLDQPALITAKLERQQNDSSFAGVLSLFNNDPNDWGDPYDADGHRLLDQVDQPANGGVATLDQLLGPGTYYLAVSGAGNLYFNPLLADSGIPGTTGDFDLLLSVDNSGLGPATGPQVLTTDPAPSAVLSSSPLAIRLDMSGPLDPSTLIPGQTVQLIFSPSGTFSPNDQQIPLASINFSPAVEDPPSHGQDAATVQHYQGINELQLFPESPLAPGYYEVFLAGKSVGGSVVVADPNGNDLNADAGNPDGQDFTDTFQVDGIDGRTGATSSDDTAATAQNLGDLTSAGIVQVAGAIGDDPFYNPADSPGNQVDMYHFSVSGPGRYALVAEVFAGRIGSPLDPGVSLFELDPSDGSLVFIAGNNNTYDPVVATDGFSTPLYTDSSLYAGLTAGDYYLAVAGGSNTPSPFEGLPPGSPGLFNPNVSHSGQDGWSTGPYVLNVLVQPAPNPPRVVSTSPSNGVTLTQPPTQLTVTFDEPVNIAQLAFQTFQVAAESTIASVYIEGADGTKYFPRFESYDNATNQATFIMLNGLPNGAYQLHLSGSAGLTDLGGNELVGNDPDGDYVVRFTVDGPARGTDGNPLEWSDQEPNDDIHHPQDLGVLFPDELAAGVTITRDFSQDPSQAPQDTADVYEFQILLGGSYSFTLSGDNLPDNVTLTLTDPTGQSVPIISIGGTLLFGDVAPGTYLLMVNGWNKGQAAAISYQLSLDLVSTNDNAPPLVSGPAPAVAVLLYSVAPPTPPSPPPPVSPPPTVTPAPVPSPPTVTPAPVPSPPTVTPAPVSLAPAGKDPAPSTSSPGPGMPITISSQPQGGPVAYGVTSTDVVALASSAVGGARGSEGSQAASTSLAQNVAALPPSSISTEVITEAISLPSGELRMDLDATSGAPKGVEEQVANAGVPMIAVASTGLEESVIWFMKSVRELLNLWAMSNPLRLSSVAAPKLAPTVIPGIIEHGVEMLSMSEADQVSESDMNLTAGDWKRALPILIATTCLTTAAYAGCRGLGRREECRGEKAKSPKSVGRPRPRAMWRRLFHDELTAGRIS
jgi:hypothetical protein